MSDILTGIDRRGFLKQAGSGTLGLATAGLASTGTTEKTSDSASVLPNIALPTGTWSILANGASGNLVINAGVNANGKVSGTVFGDPITGFWNSTSQEITFVRDLGSPDANQIYTGYYFKGPGGANYLTGYLEAFGGGGGSVTRHFFGWVARKP